jgi:hypothetical protein
MSYAIPNEGSLNMSTKKIPITAEFLAILVNIIGYK